MHLTIVTSFFLSSNPTDTAIEELVQFYATKFPTSSFTPKFHLLYLHTTDFVISKSQLFVCTCNLSHCFIYPGDWHFLTNSQEVIMKIYWNDGPKDLAKTTHFGMSLSKLQSCGNLKKYIDFSCRRMKLSTCFS